MNMTNEEKQFVEKIKAALEYGAENRDNISQEVFNVALGIPTTTPYYLKQHKQLSTSLYTHEVHTEFRHIAQYFQALQSLV